MRELSVPEAVVFDPAANLTDAVFRNAVNAPDDVAFLRRAGDGWSPVTTKEFASQVRGLAAGLIGTGIRPGDRVALMSSTRYEWTLFDYAIWTAGAVTVPIYETSSEEQVSWILQDSKAVGAVVETGRHAATVATVSGDLPALRHVWQIEQGAVERLVAAGEAVPDSEVEQRRAGVSGTDLATIIYTSGTTGRPKGCELTQLALLGTGLSASEVLPELFGPQGSTLLFLPLAHVFGRLIQVACVANRTRMGHTADIARLLPDFAAFQPTFILSVPRVFEKVYNTAKQRAHSEGKGAIFDRAEKAAIAYSEALQSGSPGMLLKAEHALFDKLVYAKLRAALGGKVSYAVSGGAPLGARLGHFFRGIGITVLEGYGLTETTASATLNTPGQLKIGTVGRPGPGCTVRITDDGEILLKGRNVFAGYWQNATATAAAIDEDGFFHTGDIGQLDEDGFLTITGRIKELIVTAGGKNVAPAVLEDRLRAHPLVSQCMVVGDNKPFIACLITLDADALPAWKKEHGKSADAAVADLAHDSDLLASLQSGVDEANKAVSRAEAIRKFTVLPEDFTEQGGQLTPSLKVKRAVVAEQYAAQIEAMYSP